MKRLIFDAHLDLSMNALEWNRDLTQSLSAIRQREEGKTDKFDRGKGTISFEEMRKGRIGICVATLIARYVKPGSSLPGWHSQAQAWAQTRGQLAWYRVMEERGEMKQIRTVEELNQHLKLWEKSENTQNLPIGYVLSIEGADSILDMRHLEQNYEEGLRALGPAHYGPGVYAQGTDATGGIGRKGKELLKKMERLNIILDTTHLCDDSFWEALDYFNGPVWASHNNCRKFVNHNRQYADEQIKVLIERDAVIGAVLDAWMLVPNWIIGKTQPEDTDVTLEKVADNIDHICQLAGNAFHSAIGSDMDGGYGREQLPKDVQTIGDLQKLSDILRKRGYSEDDIDHIFYKNWIRFLKRAWA